MRFHHLGLLLFTCLNIQEARAQDNDSIETTDSTLRPHLFRSSIKNSFISLSSGYSLPTQDYSKLWFAIPGQVFSLNVFLPSYYRKRFGVILKYDYGYNGYSKSGLVNNLTNYYGYSNLSFSVNGHVSDITYQELLFGFFYACPLKHFTILGKAFAGFMSSTYPGFIVDIVDHNTGNTGSFYENGMSGFGSPFGIGLEIRYCIYGGFSTFISADYIHSEQGCTLIVGGDAISSTGTIVSAPEGQSQQGNPYDLFHFSFGIGYQFGVKK